MAQVSAWEKRMRDAAGRLAKSVNQSSSFAMLTHETTRLGDPENVPEVVEEGVGWWKSLSEPARTHMEVAHAIAAAVIADEEENEEGLREAMQVFSRFISDLSVSLNWRHDGHDYSLHKSHDVNDAKHPLITTMMALTFANYWEQARGTIHLGLCRQCGNLYVKPKHGRKTRYCSGACRQKAYRARQKE